MAQFGVGAANVPGLYHGLPGLQFLGVVRDYMFEVSVPPDLEGVVPIEVMGLHPFTRSCQTFGVDK